MIRGVLEEDLDNLYILLNGIIIYCKCANFPSFNYEIDDFNGQIEKLKFNEIKFNTYISKIKFANGRRTFTVWKIRLIGKNI